MVSGRSSSAICIILQERKCSGKCQFNDAGGPWSRKIEHMTEQQHQLI